LGLFCKKTIGSQWTRAIDAVAANISEGYGRYSYIEMRQFVRIARGSLKEHLTWLTKAKNRKLISLDFFETMLNNTIKLSVKINNFLTSLDKQINAGKNIPNNIEQ
jgi:four helix bundle protein